MGQEAEISVLSTERNYAGPLPFCRVNLTGGSVFVLDLDAAEGLAAGVVLTPEAFSVLVREDLSYRVLRKGLELATLREHSRKELERKLKRRFTFRRGLSPDGGQDHGFNEDDNEPVDISSCITAALDRLETLDRINDRRFAENWVIGRLNRRGEGRPLLYRGLLEKGISRELSGEVLEQYFTTEAETAALSRAVKKYARYAAEPELLRQRLLARGFSPARVRAFLAGDEE